MMKTIKAVALLLGLALALTSLRLPSAEAISIKQEEELARVFLQVVLDRFELVQDALLQDYLDQLSAKILAAFPPQPFPYHFYVIKEDVYNAFATPAGHIFINSGLIMAMDDEDELAGIIAHEIAHVVCRHISDKIERSKRLQLATIAGTVAGVFLGVGGAGPAAQAVTVGSAAAGQQAALAHSREDEKQADEIGLKYLVKAGYGGEGLMEVLKKIRSRQWFGAEQIPTYLMTHPGTEERIAYIDGWLQRHPVEPKPVDAYPFRRVQTRLIAVYGQQELALRRFQTEVEDHPDDPLAHYGYGLALARSGNFSESVAQIRQALAKRPFDQFILADLGRVYFAEGQYQQALGILEGAYSLAPQDADVLFYLGRTQSEMGQFKPAAAHLEALVAQRPNYPMGYYYLGQAYTRQGQAADAHYYLGLHYYQDKNYRNAAFHLRKAQEALNDPEKRQNIDRMLKEAQAKLKQSGSQEGRARRP